jgi:prevent-host-death family protein
MATNLKEDIKPISYIKTNAADMMRYVNENKNSIIITQNGEAKAVLIDIGEYQDMQNAFHLLNIIQLSEKDVKSGNTKKSEDVFGNIKGKYNFNAKKV